MRKEKAPLCRHCRHYSERVISHRAGVSSAGLEVCTLLGVPLKKSMRMCLWLLYSEPWRGLCKHTSSFVSFLIDPLCAEPLKHLPLAAL